MPALRRLRSTSRRSKDIASSQLCRACRLAPPSVCARSLLRNLRRPHARRHPRSQVRPHPSRRAQARRDAGRCNRPARSRRANRTACYSRSARTASSTKSAASTRRAPWPSAPSTALHKSHPDWHLTLAPATLMRLRSTESQAGLTPRQRRQNVRGAFKVSDPIRRARAGTSCSSTTFSPPAPPPAPPRSHSSRQGQPPSTLQRSPAPAAFISTSAVPFDMRRAQPGIPTPAMSQLAGMHSSSSSTHQPYPRGEKDVAGKSHDSCTQAKIRCPRCRSCC